MTSNTTPLPNCAYGDLLVKNGARLRHSVAARVDLATGALHTEEYLSRDAYDWGLDDIQFRVRGAKEPIMVDEGTEFEGAGEVDFCIHPSELPDIKRAWEVYQQGGPSAPSPGRRGR